MERIAARPRSFTMLRLRSQPTETPHATAVEAGVERTLAGVGYGLIAASLLTVWVTGLVAWVIAWTHRRSPDPVARSHFRFQLLIAEASGLAVGIGAALVASGVVFVVGPLFDHDTPSGGELASGVLTALGGGLLFLLALAATVVGVGFGAIRLVRGRGVGVRRPAS